MPTSTSSSIRLCGREEELSHLEDAIQHHSLVVLSGESGTGKSTLALQLPNTLYGKFDQYQRSQDAIVRAFAQVDPFLTPAIQSSLQTALGDDLWYILDMMPSLSDTLQTPRLRKPTPSSTLQEKTQIKLTFRKFVRILCRELSLLLLLDDVQWADTADYLVLRDLLLDDTIQRKLTILLVCRIVPTRHKLSAFLQRLSHQVAIHDIVLENVNHHATQEFLQLELGGDCHASLIDHVYTQTDGNFFHMKHLIHSFIEEGSLEKSSGSNVWRLSDSVEPPNELTVVEFLQSRLRRFSEDVQRLLQIASCLGVEFGIDVLSLLLPSTGTPVERLSEYCIQKGLLSRKLDSKIVLMSFSHDRVQQAAYSLIPPKDTKSFHLAIGRTLRKTLTEEQMMEHEVLVTSQLLFGSSLIKNYGEREALSVMCLRSGQRLCSVSAFDDAGKFIMRGIGLLGENPWEANYALSLELHNAGAEISCAVANFEQVEVLSQAVFENAKSFDDKLTCYTTRVYVLGSTDRITEARDEGLRVLEQLGEGLPRSVGIPCVVLESIKTKRLMRRMSGRKLLHLPPMTNSKKLTALCVMNLLYSYTLWSGDLRAVVLTFRSIQMTIHHGLSSMSAVAVATYASYQCSFGNVEDGYRLGQYALEILEMFDSREWAGRVLSLVCSFVTPWKDDTAEQIDRFSYASQASFDTGDNEVRG